MPLNEIVCARCTDANHPSTRFCARCGLPLGSAQPDADAGADALGPFEALDPEDADTPRIIRELVERSGYPATPSAHGWRIDVPSHLDRRQAVYIGHAGTDPEGRSILSLVSVCGPVNQRDALILLKLNARVSGVRPTAWRIGSLAAWTCIESGRGMRPSVARLWALVSPSEPAQRCRPVSLRDGPRVRWRSSAR
jgi:hypothetical protein